MYKNLSGVACSLLSSLTVSGILIFSHNQVLAQVTPDDTLGDESSVVNTRDATSDSIDGGAIRGQNLFHSFQEFNVDAGRGVYFANPEAVTNIFSRVTGNDVSDILGTLGVDGAANLFLINPNGIIFGEGASLDVQGSFAATTADGIEFGEQGFFSASNPESPNLLTINPSAYLFNQVAPGAIVNNSRANNNIGLQVQPGKSLSLIGGDVSLNGGNIKAPAGNVNLGGLSAVGTIDINSNGSLSFPESVPRSNVFLTQAALVDASGTEGGNITVNAGDLEISGNSELQTGTFATTGLPSGQSGDIILNATGAVEIDASTLDAGVEIGNAGNITIFATEDIFLNTGDIFSNVGGKNVSQAEGNAGEITINANSLSLTNGAQIQSGVFKNNLGNGSDVTLNARDNVTIFSSDQRKSGIFTDLEQDVVGDAGNINIEAQGSILLNNAVIKNTNDGTGNAGDINLDTKDKLEISNESLILSDGFYGRIFLNSSNSSINIKDSFITAEDDNNINDTDKFSLIKITALQDSINIDNSLITTENAGIGFAGDINLNAKEKIEILDTPISSRGNLGRILIGKSDLSNETLSPQEANFNNSFLTVSNNSVITDPKTQINAGVISINAVNNISFVNNSSISTDTERLGNAGDLTVRSENGSVSLYNSNIFSNVEVGGIGDAGDINITADSIFLTNGAQLQSGVKETLDDSRQNDIISTGGNIILNAEKNITLSGSSLNNKPSGIFTDVESNAIGIAGNINITTNSLFLTDQAILTTRSSGLGYAGNITVNANSMNLDNNSKIEALNTPPAGNSITLSSGNIDLQISDNLILRDSDISTEASINANGGNIDIEADSIIAFDDSDIFAFAADGRGGNITLDTPAYFAENFTLNSLTRDPDSLDNNSRADLNATGAVSGVVSIPDVSFIQNGLNNLPDNSINTDELVANSCVSPVGKRQEGKFIITGTGGLPVAPGNDEIADFATGEVRSVPSNNSGWQRGDAIVEPQGVYRLTNGKLVMSRECHSP